MSQFIALIKRNKSYFFYLFFTFAFFLFKGIEYVVLKSPIPLATIFCICIFFYYSTASMKTFYRFITFWTSLLFLWASIRILLSLLHRYINPLSEYHVDHQLGVKGILLSITLLSIAVYLRKDRKGVFIADC